MEVPCFAGSSSSSLVTKAGKKRKLEEEGAPAAGVPLTAKPWLDDGVNEGEDTEEMDLNELKEAFEDDEEEEQLSPKVTQELDMSIEDEVTAIAERIESDKKKHSKGHDGKAWEQPKAQTTEQSGEEDIPWDSPKPKNKKRRLDTKPACSYGANCYRKNSEHRTQFWHPGDDPEGKDKMVVEKEEEEEPVETKCVIQPQATKGGSNKNAPTSGSSSVIEGKVVVLTGALMISRKEAAAKLNAMGASVANSISRNTDIVVVGDKAGSKLEKAESCGCEIWSEDKFMNLVREWEGNHKQQKDRDHDEEKELKEKKISVKKGVFNLEGEEDEEEKAGEEWDEEKSSLPKAKNLIPVGESSYVQSSSGGGKWQIKRCAGDVYYCLCPAWKNQNHPIDRRTCKHLREFLGDEHETARCGSEASVASGKKGRGIASSKQEAPKLLLAHKWEEKVDPTGWWLSEKLDGVRAYWNGKAFISRLGNSFPAPDWFIEGLPPDIPLDGELFGGRGKFQITVSVAKSQGADTRWKGLQYRIFDAPGLNKPFEERMQTIRDWFDSHPTEYAKVLKMQKCKGKAHMEEELKRIEEKGGEGLMLRKAKSLYVAGRSTTLLKVKSFQDAEAVIVAYEPGKGKHKGRVGAFSRKMASGKSFKVGTGLSDAERENPPPIGSIITYKFQELTPDGVPRFPSYVGIRTDVDKPQDPVVPKKAK